MLELAVLGLLTQGPMHGYDLRKRLRDGFGPMANLSFGSLYPALGRLETAGAVRVVTGAAQHLRKESAAEAVLTPLTGSLTGERAALAARRATAKAAAALTVHSTRSRKVYEITPAGEGLFEQLLEAPAPGGDEARSFSLRISFARHLSPQARVRLLERHRALLADGVDLARRHLVAPDHELDHYELVVAEHALEVAERDLAWTGQLLAEEREAFAATVAAARTAAIPTGGSTQSTTGDTKQSTYGQSTYGRKDP